MIPRQLQVLIQLIQKEQHGTFSVPLLLVLFQSCLVKPSPSLPLVDELSINWLVVSIPMGDTDAHSTELGTL